MLRHFLMILLIPFSALAHDSSLDLYFFSDKLKIPSYCKNIISTVSEGWYINYACDPNYSDGRQLDQVVNIEFHSNHSKTVGTFKSSSRLINFQQEKLGHYTHYFASYEYINPSDGTTPFNLFCSNTICLQITGRDSKHLRSLVTSIKNQLVK
jgi:hypothetical protein